MIEDMTIRRLAPKTQQSYIRTIKSLAAFLGRSPDQASFEDIRRFQLHVAQSGVGTGALNATVTALRFFFRVTLIRRFLIHVLPTGFHRIRHYGLFASHKRAENIARARELLNSPALQTQPSDQMPMSRQRSRIPVRAAADA
jgi:hypothetical protein